MRQYDPYHFGRYQLRLHSFVCKAFCHEVFSKGVVVTSDIVPTESLLIFIITNFLFSQIHFTKLPNKLFTLNTSPDWLVPWGFSATSIWTSCVSTLVPSSWLTAVATTPLSFPAILNYFFGGFSVEESELNACLSRLLDFWDLFGLPGVVIMSVKRTVKGLTRSTTLCLPWLSTLKRRWCLNKLLTRNYGVLIRNRE